MNAARPITRVGPQGRRRSHRKFFTPPEKMCWTQFKNIGHSSNNLGRSRKTLRPSWCPKLVTAQRILTKAQRILTKSFWNFVKENILVKKILPTTIICDFLNYSQENVVIEVKQIPWCCLDSFFSKINVQIQSWSKKIASILQDIQSWCCPYSPLIPTHFDNYFAEIASVHKYQSRHASLQKYYLPRMKTSLGQLTLKYMGPTLWYTHSWKFEIFFALLIWQTIEKHLARIPVDFRFLCLSQSVILRWCHYLPPYLPPQLLTQHPLNRHAFDRLFLLFFYAYNTWL